jgi:hypothetical protein
LGGEGVTEAQQFLDRVTEFERRDRRRMTMATIVAIIIWALVATTSLVIVSRARAQLAAARVERAQLKQQAVGLQNKLRQIGAETAELESKNSALQSENVRLEVLVHGPLKQVIKPRLTMRRNPNLTFRGLPLFDIILFLDLPVSRRDEIASVKYEINHPTKIEKSMEGTIPETGFAVSYRGYLCFDKVAIRVVPKVGDSFTIPYDMCKDWASPPQ